MDDGSGSGLFLGPPEVLIQGGDLSYVPDLWTFSALLAHSEILGVNFLVLLYVLDDIVYIVIARVTLLIDPYCGFSSSQL